MSADTIDLPEIRSISGPEEAPGKTGDGSDRRKGWQVIAALVLLLVGVLAVDQIIRSGYFTIERVMISNRLQHVDQGIVERNAWRKAAEHFNGFVLQDGASFSQLSHKLRPVKTRRGRFGCRCWCSRR